jgi:hypothetical protein
MVEKSERSLFSSHAKTTRARRKRTGATHDAAWKRWQARTRAYRVVLDQLVPCLKKTHVNMQRIHAEVAAAVRPSDVSQLDVERIVHNQEVIDANMASFVSPASMHRIDEETRLLLLSADQ